MDFNIGSYAYSKDARSQYEALKEMPPYEDAIEKGEELYTKNLQMVTHCKHVSLI